MTDFTSAKQSPLDKLGLKLDSNLYALKTHGRLLASDLESLETNLVLMFQALSMQDIVIFQLKERLNKLETKSSK